MYLQFGLIEMLTSYKEKQVAADIEFLYYFQLLTVHMHVLR